MLHFSKYNRFDVLRALIFIFAIVLLGRLFYWQVVKASDLLQTARFQYEIGKKISSSRGNILSSDNTWLASSQETWLVYVMKNEIKSVSEVSSKLAPILEVAESELRKTLDNSNSIWVPIKHKVPTLKKKQIMKEEIDGVGFEAEESRFYPEASSASQILGFVGKDDEGKDKGYFGIEGYYELTLSGRDGMLERELDAKGVPILFGDSKEILAHQGVNLVTFIDKRIQLLIEKKLKEGLEKYGAKSGSIAVMDPSTGAILALTSDPSYDPTHYYDYGDEFFRNPIISDAFEPGSIFKPIVMAAGIDAGVITPETICDVCDHAFKVDKYFIETWDKKYFPNSTMTEVLVHSDNVGMTFVGSKLGPEKLYDYISKFGFGKLTGIDLQGEVTAPLRKKGTWNIVDQATATFGQGIAVTPIQMMKAIGIIANKGREIKPQVVNKLSVEGWEEKIEPEVGAQIVSEKAASQLTGMMVAAVKKGEAKWTSARGFDIAGKTGTAQIAVSGHYDAEKTNASFIGFAPATDPKFVMLVTLKEPSSSPWASETAAPLWMDISKELFAYFGIQPKS